MHIDHTVVGDNQKTEVEVEYMDEKEVVNNGNNDAVYEEDGA